jgi:methyl-accepting chemotaxis protein
VSVLKSPRIRLIRLPRIPAWLKPNLRLSTKMQLVVVSAAIVLAIGIGASSYISAERNAGRTLKDHFNSLLQGRKAALQDYLGSLEEDVRFMASSPNLKDTMTAFSKAAQESSQAAMQAPPPPPPAPTEDETAAAEAAPETMPEMAAPPAPPPAPPGVDEQTDAWLRKFVTERGYEDLYLIDLDGNVVYSAVKGPEAGTNISTRYGGSTVQTDLAVAFEVLSGETDMDRLYFFDYAPYAPAGNRPASFIAASISGRDGNRVGVLAFRVPVSRFNRIMDVAEGLGKTGELMLIGEDFLMRNDSRLVGKPTILAREVNGEAIKNTINSGKPDFSIDKGPMGYEVQTFTTPVDFNDVRWALVAQVATEEANAPLAAMRNTMLGVAALLLLLVATSGVLFARRISKPVTILTGAMRKLAAGDTSVELDGAERRDEIGEMTAAVEVFRANAIERQNLEEREQLERAEKEKRTAAVESLIAAFDTSMKEMLGSVSAAASQMEHTSIAMTQTAELTNERAAQVASASEQATANIQTVASATEEMASSIEEIRRQTGKSNDIGTYANETAAQTNAKVHQLTNAAQQIGEIVTLIQQIAGQTNLLALNATIEAARAGEAGRGFAVVATEVKALATQTAKATEDIANQIGAIQDSTSDTVKAIQEIGKVIEEINAIGHAISDSIEQQNASTQEISRSVSEVANGSRDVANNILEVTGAANESANAAGQVRSAAAELAAQASKLSDEVDRFLREVRAA